MQIRLFFLELSVFPVLINIIELNGEPFSMPQDFAPRASGQGIGLKGKEARRLSMERANLLWWRRSVGVYSEGFYDKLSDLRLR
jgi:hypothetical protein